MNHLEENIQDPQILWLEHLDVFEIGWGFPRLSFDLFWECRWILFRNIQNKQKDVEVQLRYLQIPNIMKMEA